MREGRRREKKVGTIGLLPTKLITKLVTSLTPQTYNLTYHENLQLNVLHK